MNVIFLDNDGVLCLEKQYGTRFVTGNIWDDMDPDAVNRLNQICHSTGAKIVVTSTWRNFGTFDGLKAHYSSQGISEVPIGMTRQYKELVTEEHPELTGWRIISQSPAIDRAVEIRDYLANNPGISQYLIIDDIDMRSTCKYLDSVLFNESNCIVTKEQSGLTDKLMRRCIELFNDNHLVS